MPIDIKQIKEFQIKYVPVTNNLAKGEGPKIIAIIRDGHLTNFIMLDFPNEITTPFYFADQWMKSDWQGWLAFMCEIGSLRTDIPKEVEKC